MQAYKQPSKDSTFKGTDKMHPFFRNPEQMIWQEGLQGEEELCEMSSDRMEKISKE